MDLSDEVRVTMTSDEYFSQELEDTCEDLEDRQEEIKELILLLGRFDRLCRKIHENLGSASVSISNDWVRDADTTIQVELQVSQIKRQAHRLIHDHEWNKVNISFKEWDDEDKDGGFYDVTLKFDTDLI